MKKWSGYFLLMLVMASFTSATADDTSGLRLATGVTVEWKMQYIVNSTNIREYNPLDETWLDGFFLQCINTDFSMNGLINDRVGVGLDFRGGISYDFPDELSPEVKTIRNQYAVMRQAYGDWFPRGASDSTRVRLGVFPHDYGPQHRLLGRYMFMTGTYPGFILNSDDEPLVMGMHAAFIRPRFLRHDLFLKVEMEYPPMGDISPTYIATVSTNHFFLNLGVMLHRLIWAEARRTRPLTLQTASLAARRIYVDGADTTWYSKSGVKLMGCVVYDFKHICTSDKLGREDLKLYLEGAVLGVKNYPGYYDDFFERCPLMAGFTLPAFGLLDVLAVEAEYYGSRWRNDADESEYAVPYKTFRYEVNSGIITPVFVSDPASEDGGKQAREDDVKWGVYARTSLKKISLSLKLASDHFRGNTPTERLNSPRDWYAQGTCKVRF